MHPLGPNYFNFMQFLEKFGKIVCWCPLSGEFAPPSHTNPAHATENTINHHNHLHTQPVNIPFNWLLLDTIGYLAAMQFMKEGNMEPYFFHVLLQKELPSGYTCYSSRGSGLLAIFSEGHNSKIIINGPLHCNLNFLFQMFDCHLRLVKFIPLQACKKISQTLIWK